MKTYLQWSFILINFFVFNCVSAQSTCDKLQYCNHSSIKIDKRKLVNDIERGAFEVPTLIGNMYSNFYAQNIVNRILCLANASSTKVTVKGYNCTNAMAVDCNHGKYILFSTTYLQTLLSSVDSSVVYGLFAHEVAHIIRGDSWIGETDIMRHHESELNADAFAGRILGLLGKSEETALGTLNQVSVNSSDTHPSKALREKAILDGWQFGIKERATKNVGKFAYEMQCISANDRGIDFKLEYKKTALNNFTDNYKVDCYITGDSNDLKKIKRVAYYLHPTTFIRNTKEVIGNKPISIKIWGSFELRASIIYDLDGTEDEYIVKKMILIYGRSNRPRYKTFSSPVLENIESTNTHLSTIPVIE